MTSGSEIALRPTRMHLCKPTAPAVATVVKNVVCTAGRKAAGFTRHIEFDVTGTELAGACVPGQAVGVLPDGADKDGREHKLRLYSLASPTRGEDGSGRVISTTVRRVIDEDWNGGGLFLGVASNWLCDRKVGDRVRLTGPNGKRFVLPADAGGHDYVFFATGTGVAPFRGMLTDLLEDPATAGPGGGKVMLVMGAAYETDLLYHQWLNDLAARHARFSYVTALSRQPNAGGHGPMYVQDRIRTDAEGLGALLHGERTLVYICGAAGMEIGIFKQMALSLPAAAREGYIEADAETLADVGGWTRSMLHKQVKLTRRVFMEVY